MQKIVRKEIKKNARRVLKKHYFLFLAVCLIAAFINSEFSGSLSVIESKITDTYAVYVEVEENTEQQTDPVWRTISLNDVISNILEGNTEQGKELSNQIHQENLKRAKEGNPAFGRTRGVLSNILNQISSGSVFLTAVAAVNSITGSRNAGIFLLIILGALLFFSFWFFFQNLFIVISRRIFLEGRCYEEVPIQRFIFLLRIKRWIKASWTMFVLYIFHTLWTLTIIGGIIKHYSYFLVPYIVAENPDIPACKAITISRKMMDGHKWECLKMELSFLGWDLLGALTGGLTNIFFANLYKTAAFTEYFAEVRKEAKSRKVFGTELLNDQYLYRRAEEEVIRQYYEDVIAVMNKPCEEMKNLKGWKGFLAKNFGILIFRTEREKQYEKNQAEKVRIAQMEKAVKGIVYPVRLFPIPEQMKRSKIETLHYIRHYSAWSLVMMFFLFSIIGWTWEVSLHLVTEGVFVNRGVLHGPWLPIYGSGGILILTLLNRLRKNPVIEFVAIIIVCGTIEYFTSFILEHLTGGKRWWDYSGYFLNLHGRICAEGLLIFGLGGIGIVYVLAPLLDNLLMKIEEEKLKTLCIVLLVVFLVDQGYSIREPNQGKGITNEKKKMTEEQIRRYSL